MSSFRDAFNPIFAGAPVMNAYRFEDLPNFSNEMLDQVNVWKFRDENEPIPEEADKIYDEEVLVDELLPTEYVYNNYNELAMTPPPQVANLFTSHDISVSQEVLDSPPLIVEGFQTTTNNNLLISIVLIIIVIIIIYFLNKRF